ncbi:indolethylamine N-methyltransferase-like [Rhinophrynus dorsalis]
MGWVTYRYKQEKEVQLLTYEITSMKACVQAEVPPAALAAASKPGAETGTVKGDTLIDLTVTPLVFHLLVAADYFKEITMLESNDRCLRHIKMWLNNEEGAIDWSHAAMFACALNGESERWKEQEAKLRRCVKHVLKVDFTKPNPLDPVTFPQADCLTSLGYLEFLSKNHDNYRSNLKKMSSFLKVGGYLFMLSAVNMSYFMVGQHKVSVLKCDDEFVRKALLDTGFIIEDYEKIESKLNTHLVDIEHIHFLVARKARE